MKYNYFGKKILITEKNTEKCSNGCYVLISIVSNSINHKIGDDEILPLRISINPRIMKADHNVESPKVKIFANEFIIGDIEYSLSAKRKYDYYYINLPHDSDYIYIDWQADSPYLLINVGEERPKMNKANFIFTPIGHDTVYKINKNEILIKGGLNNKQSLKDLTLTLGIYSEINDNIQSSPYAFKIFLPSKVEKDEYKVAAQIIHIRTDEKVQCLPFKYKNKNICSFVSIFTEKEGNINLVLYPRNFDGSSLNIYGQLVEAEPIERNNITEITKIIEQTFENEKYKYKEKNKYIYLEGLERTKPYFFIISAADNSNSVIEVLSSTNTYYNDINLYPNPSTSQIFAIRDYKVNLNFMTTNDLLLNIVCLSGSGQLYWKDEKGKDKKYLLEGYDDRLILTSYTQDQASKLVPLKVESSTSPTISKGGFVFYITFNPRNNIDQLKAENFTEFHYRTVKMPLYYYVPIKLNQDWNINFNFYDFGIKNNEILIYDTNLFNIWATIISEKEANKARTEINYKPKFDSNKIIKGIFDSTFGNIFLSKNDINKIYKDTNQTANILFSIEKLENINTEFISLGFELNIYSNLKTSGINSVPEGIYMTDKLSHSPNNKLIYLLQLDKNKTYIRIEYAANSDLFKFALSINKTSEKNDNFSKIKTEQKSGRNLITIKLDNKFFSSNNSLYFIVFSQEKNINSQLDYFSFRYTSVKEESSFMEFLAEDKRNVDLDISGNNYKLSFSPIALTNASYYIKAIYKDGLIQGEKIDSIAISESKGKYLQMKNPSLKKLDPITCELDIDQEVSYIKVMVRYNYNNQKLFYLYKPVEVKHNLNKTILYIIIGVCSVLVIIVIVLVIFICFYKQKNKDLLNKVNKISFAVSDGKENDPNEDNLLYENEK